MAVERFVNRRLAAVPRSATLWALLLLSAAVAAPGRASEELGRFEIFLDGVMAAQFRDYELAGMTFVLVHDGRQVFSKGFGVASLETGAPVDPALTLFRPGSVSKLVTWTAVMQLVEQGKLSLGLFFLCAAFFLGFAGGFCLGGKIAYQE